MRQSDGWIFAAAPCHIDHARLLFVSVLSRSPQTHEPMKASSFLIRISGIVMVLVSITTILPGAETIKTQGSVLSKKTIDGKKITVVTPSIRKQIATPVIRNPEAPSLFKFTREGPVISTDPYYTAHIGEHRVFRDALDSTLAYYEPVISIGSPVVLKIKTSRKSAESSPKSAEISLPPA